MMKSDTFTLLHYLKPEINTSSVHTLKFAVCSQANAISEYISECSGLL